MFGNSYCEGHAWDEMAGQAFTKWQCKICGYKGQHHNTAIPTICPECAVITNRCSKCGKLVPLDYEIICTQKNNCNSEIISNYQEYKNFINYIKRFGDMYELDYNKYSEEYFLTKSLAILNIKKFKEHDGILISIDGNTLIYKIKGNISIKSKEGPKVILVEIDKSITNFKIQT